MFVLDKNQRSNHKKFSSHSVPAFISSYRIHGERSQVNLVEEEKTDKKTDEGNTQRREGIGDREKV